MIRRACEKRRRRTPEDAVSPRALLLPRRKRLSNQCRIPSSSLDEAQARSCRAALVELAEDIVEHEWLGRLDPTRHRVEELVVHGRFGERTCHIANAGW